MNPEEQNIINTYHDYVRAFETLEPNAILPYYHAPCMIISSKKVYTLATPEEIASNFALGMEALRKAEYKRTDIIDLDVKLKGIGVAVVIADLKRYTRDGKQLGSQGGIYRYTYTFRKEEDRWRVVAAISHDPNY